MRCRGVTPRISSVAFGCHCTIAMLRPSVSFQTVQLGVVASVTTRYAAPRPAPAAPSTAQSLVSVRSRARLAAGVDASEQKVKNAPPSRTPPASIPMHPVLLLGGDVETTLLRTCRRRR